MTRILTTLEAPQLRGYPLVFAAGAFDGVHRGHQAVLAEARRVAREKGGQAWALTFDPHPLKILRPDRAPALLTSTPHRLQLLSQSGIEGIVLLPFSREFAEQSPEEFVRAIRRATPALAAVVVGENWHFGKAARGDVRLLKEFGRELGFEAIAVPPIEWNGAPISSTRIRRAVAEGDLAAAEQMLGRPFSVLGTVIHGIKLGRRLGYPTANLDPHNEARPPPGIYACRARVGNDVYPAAAFLAAAPDPRKGPPDLIEVHLLDVELDLYGKDIEVEFIARLREERAFESQEALIAQIARDIEAARAALAAKRP